MDDWIGTPPRITDELVAFDAMRSFLEAYWERGGRTSDDIAALLGSLNRNEALGTPPLDIAQWKDWQDAIARAIAASVR